MGYDISSIGEDNSSISDTEVIHFANKENRLIDRDYGELIFRHKIKPSAGVLYLRLHIFSPESPAAVVYSLLNNDELDFSLKLTVFDGQTIRQRKYEKG